MPGQRLRRGSDVACRPFRVHDASGPVRDLGQRDRRSRRDGPDVGSAARHQVRDAPMRVHGHAVEDGPEQARPALHGSPVQDGRVVHEPDLEAGCRLAHRDLEIRPGVRSGHGPPSHFQPRPHEGRIGEALVREHRLQPYSPASLLDDVERRGGVDEGVDVGRPDCVDEVREGRIAVHVRAQGHGAHEHSDQLVEQRIVAAGLGSPQQGVRRAGDRRQQHRDRRMQHHEGRRVDAPGHGTERRPHLTVEAGRDPLRAAAGCRPGSIQRHTGNGWSPFEHALPEPEIAVTDPRVQQFVLPARVVRVIHRQRGPRGRRACASRGVGRGEIGDQRRERESVESDVMRHDDEFVTPVADSVQREPDRHVGREVERFGHEVVDQPLGFVTIAHVPRTEHSGPVDFHETRPWFPVGVLGQHRAQRCVPPEDVTQSVPQRLLRQLAHELDDERHVVGSARRIELVLQPQSSLRRGERCRAVIGRNECRALGRARDDGSQTRGGPTGEDVTNGHAASGDRGDPRGETGGAQGVAAVVEEVRRRVHLDTEDALHLVGDEFLHHTVHRSTVGAVRCGCSVDEHGTVDLPTRGERQRVEQHHSGRNGMGGQAFREPLAQSIRPQSVTAREGHQPFVDGYGRRGADTPVGDEERIDLARFDADPAQLDLMVDPSDDVEGPIRAPPGQVAGAVHPAATEGRGHEASRGRSGVAGVPAGERRAQHVDLADDARRAGA